MSKSGHPPGKYGRGMFLSIVIFVISVAAFIGGICSIMMAGLASSERDDPNSLKTTARWFVIGLTLFGVTAALTWLTS